jgi:hypothetical protein
MSEAAPQKIGSLFSYTSLDTAINEPINLGKVLQSNTFPKFIGSRWQFALSILIYSDSSVSGVLSSIKISPEGSS